MMNLKEFTTLDGLEIYIPFGDGGDLKSGGKAGLK
jgi:hypothetical protein